MYLTGVSYFIYAIIFLDHNSVLFDIIFPRFTTVTAPLLPHLLSFLTHGDRLRLGGESIPPVEYVPGEQEEHEQPAAGLAMPR